MFFKTIFSTKISLNNELSRESTHTPCRDGSELMGFRWEGPSLSFFATKDFRSLSFFQTACLSERVSLSLKAGETPEECYGSEQTHQKTSEVFSNSFQK